MPQIEESGLLQTEKAVAFSSAGGVAGIGSLGAVSADSRRHQDGPFETDVFDDCFVASFLCFLLP